MLRCIPVVLCLLFACVESSRAGPPVIQKELTQLYAGSFALVIGIADYDEGSGWDDLPGVKQDREAIRELLERSGFSRVHVVVDPGKEALEDAISGFLDRYGENPENRLLIYYAGHGDTVTDPDEGRIGFIIPKNISVNNKRDAVQMDWIQDQAETVAAKHVLFLFDSCFSGALFQRTRSGTELASSIQYLAQNKVRQFITSGSAGQEVPDKSIFRRKFEVALEGSGDLDRDGFITGTELGMYLRAQVSDRSKNRQTPQFARLSKEGFLHGDFLFLSPFGSPIDSLHGDGHSPEKPEVPNLSSPDSFRDCESCPEMIVVRQGSFLFGSPTGEPGRHTNEPEALKTEIVEKFYLSRYETTLAQWRQCFAEGGCSEWLPPSGANDAEVPVAGISWNQALEFTHWLSDKTGYVYRLPREEEWEYAARATTDTARYWGDELGKNHASCAACGSVFDNKYPAPIGSFAPNEWGLHDMLGNLWEWVDACDEVMLDEPGGSAIDQSRPQGDCYLKGGSFATSPRSIRAAARGYYPPDKAQANFGFRVLREP
jgi:formylglycine-generating enzyme required for sulfatase activity